MSKEYKINGGNIIMKIIKKIVAIVENVAIKEADRGLRKSTLLGLYEIKIPDSLLDEQKNREEKDYV